MNINEVLSRDDFCKSLRSFGELYLSHQIKKTSKDKMLTSFSEFSQLCGKLITEMEPLQYSIARESQIVLDDIDDHLFYNVECISMPDDSNDDIKNNEDVFRYLKDHEAEFINNGHFRLIPIDFVEEDSEEQDSEIEEKARHDLGIELYEKSKKTTIHNITREQRRRIVESYEKLSKTAKDDLKAFVKRAIDKSGGSLSYNSFKLFSTVMTNMLRDVWNFHITETEVRNALTGRCNSVESVCATVHGIVNIKLFW